MKIKIIVLSLIFGARLAAQTSDPSTLPLVQAADLVPAGNFLVPLEFTYGGEALAFNPSGPSLFLARQGEIGEISIPTPSLTSTPRATFRQPLSGFVWQHMAEIGPYPGDRLGGLLVHNGRLLCNAYYSFDASNGQERSHCAHALNLADSLSWRGFSQVGGDRKAGFVAGGMALVPAEWQARLGGDCLTGTGGLSIIYRTSSGPSAWSMECSKVGDPTVAATGLVAYTQDHATLGSWSSTAPSDVFGMSTTIGGMAIVPGTRALLVIAGHGTGVNCYGSGTADPNLTGQPTGDGEHYCYDPLNPYKATHSYPYRYQIYAYDLNELAAVKAGQKQPWDVVPYGIWPIALGPMQAPARLGMTIDMATKRLYISEYKGEPDCCGGGQPLIHTFDVKVGTAAPPPPPPPPPPVVEPPPPPPIDPVVALTARVTELEAQVKGLEATKALETARIAAIKTLIQQALNASKPNTAKAILNPLNEAMKK